MRNFSSCRPPGIDSLPAPPRHARAVVYNNFMRALGGGERSTLAFAKALDVIGYDTEVLCLQDLPSREALLSRFGEEFASIVVRAATSTELQASINAPDCTVFVNHTFLSFLRNPTPIGIHALMFPAKTLDPEKHARSQCCGRRSGRR